MRYVLFSLSFLLMSPVVAGAIGFPNSDIVLVGAEALVALTASAVACVRAFQTDCQQRRRKLLALALAMGFLAAGEALCNIDFLRGTVTLRGQKAVEMFYVGFWTNLAVFLRWNYGPVWRGKRWWPALPSMGFFTACCLIQLSFVGPDYSQIAGILQSHPQLLLWIAVKAVTATLAMAYTARATLTRDFVFLHAVLAMFCFALASSYRFEVLGFTKYWIECGWLAALFTVSTTIACGQSPHLEDTCHVSSMSSWFSLRSLLGLAGFLTGASALLAAKICGTLTIYAGLDIPLLTWSLFCAWAISNSVALRLYRHMVDAIERVVRRDSLPRPGEPSLVAEFAELFRHYEVLAAQQIETAKAAMRADRDAELGRLAAQVAHDIRSPLAALQMAITSDDYASDENREMLRLAAFRVKGIAEDLLRRSRGEQALHEMTENSSCVEQVVQNILREKRAGLPPDGHVLLESFISPQARSVAVSCATNDLSRSLPNLIDNSAEALGKCGGIIKVLLSADPQIVSITISDDGPGIHPDTLSKLGRRGATFGKTNGNGLGLFGARRLAEDAGGTFAIESKVGQGTQVRLSLPRAHS